MCICTSVFFLLILYRETSLPKILGKAVSFLQGLYAAAVLLLPLFGTALGAAAVCFPRWRLCRSAGIMEGFAAGVMTAAGFFSLLLPAIEQSGYIPAVSGFLLGAAGILLMETLLPEELDAAEQRTRMLIFSVTLHNIPEGMAVGVAAAGALRGCGAMAAALALSVGIAVQNIPEGCIISLPLHERGLSRCRSALGGVLSGAVEPLAALASLLLTAWLSAALPFVLSFAAGAMWSVTAGELLPAAVGKKGAAASAVGFALMMWLDVMLS